MEKLKYNHKKGVTVCYSDNNLTTIDSREVAEMLGKEHSYVLEMIQGREGKLGIIPVLTNANLAVVKYFVESSYIDKKGEKRKCYLVTKMGCELLGNKQQGEKGILFTAKYVERFNQMEQAIKGEVFNTSKLSKELQAILMLDEKTLEIDNRLASLEERMTIETGAQKVLQDLVNKKVITALGGKDSPAYTELGKKAFRQCWKNFKDILQVASYKDTPVKDFDLAKKVIIDWQPNRELELMIRGCNAQMRMCKRLVKWKD